MSARACTWCGRPKKGQGARKSMGRAVLFEISCILTKDGESVAFLKRTEVLCERASSRPQPVKRFKKLKTRFFGNGKTVESRHIVVIWYSHYQEVKLYGRQERCWPLMMQGFPFGLPFPFKLFETGLLKGSFLETWER